jgi:hypothetical protein
MNWNKNLLKTDGQTIFSYGSHWPIAYRIGTPGEQNTFLVNTDVYSVSTSSHTRQVERAIRNYYMDKKGAVIWPCTRAELRDICNRMAYGGTACPYTGQRSRIVYLRSDGKERLEHSLSNQDLWELLYKRYWNDCQIKLLPHLSREEIDRRRSEKVERITLEKTLKALG